MAGIVNPQALRFANERIRTIEKVAEHIRDVGRYAEMMCL